MKLELLLANLSIKPDQVEFNDVISVIDNNYAFTPVTFVNGDCSNEAGQNNGSCKIFAFARIHGLTEQQTLHCFGGYYRDDVMRHPEHDDHQNIRNFIRYGWQGVKFEADPLLPKQA